jgi:hypothetical protein
VSEDRLITRVEQAIAAFAKSSSDDFTKLRIVQITTPNLNSIRIDPNEGIPREDLYNEISLLLTAIGSMKDHFNALCKTKGIPSYGDDIINNNRDVALIHDLWNVDKHFELSRKPRSGIVPELRNVSRVVMISASGENAVAGMSFNPETGRMEIYGDTQLVLSAMIFDESGKFVADFRATCEKAIDIWVGEFAKLGVSL